MSAERNVEFVRVVRYGAMGFVGEFSYRGTQPLGIGARVVIQTERGIELGEPIGVPCTALGCDVAVPRDKLQTYVQECGSEFCQPRSGRILRAATPADVSEHQHLNAHVREDINACAELVYQLGLDMRIVTAEHLLGGERIVFYFRSPGRVDFRQLVKELAHRYRTRIEMRQVGARDEARLVADYEVCGRECCCRNFLKKLRPVNMKMAKLQKSTLDPSKVSGRCGRLRCCLRYEHFGYEELMKRLPRVGSRVDTEYGPATVLDRQVLTQLVLVRTENDHVVTVPLEEIKEFDLPPPKPKAQPPETPAAAAPAADADEAEFRKRDGRRRSRRGRGKRGAPGEEARPEAAPEAAPPAAEKESAADEGSPEEPMGTAAGPADAERGAGGTAVPRKRRRRGRRRRPRGPDSSSGSGPSAGLGGDG